MDDCSSSVEPDNDSSRTLVPYSPPSSILTSPTSMASSISSNRWANDILTIISALGSITIGGIVYTCVYTTVTTTGATVGVTLGLTIKIISNGIVNVLHFALPSQNSYGRCVEHFGNITASIVESTTIASTDQTAALLATIAGTATGYLSHIVLRHSLNVVHRIVQSRSLFGTSRSFYYHLTKRQNGYNDDTRAWEGYADLLEDCDEWMDESIIVASSVESLPEPVASSLSSSESETETIHDNDTAETDTFIPPPISPFFFYPMDKYIVDNSPIKQGLSTITLSPLPIKSSHQSSMHWWLVHSSPSSANMKKTEGTVNNSTSSHVPSHSWIILPSASKKIVHRLM